MRGNCPSRHRLQARRRSPNVPCCALHMRWLRLYRTTIGGRQDEPESRVGCKPLSARSGLEPVVWRELRLRALPGRLHMTASRYSIAEQRVKRGGAGGVRRFSNLQSLNLTANQLGREQPWLALATWEAGIRHAGATGLSAIPASISGAQSLETSSGWISTIDRRDPLCLGRDLGTAGCISVTTSSRVRSRPSLGGCRSSVAPFPEEHTN